MSCPNSLYEYNFFFGGKYVTIVYILFLSATYLKGCRNFISHFPSGKTVTSLAIISISFAALSPSRFERTTRMSGAMPLIIIIILKKQTNKLTNCGIESSPRNDDNGYVIALAPDIEFLEARIKLDVYSNNMGENVDLCLLKKRRGPNNTHCLVKYLYICQMYVHWQQHFPT